MERPRPGSSHRERTILESGVACCRCLKRPWTRLPLSLGCARSIAALPACSKKLEMIAATAHEVPVGAFTPGTSATPTRFRVSFDLRLYLTLGAKLEYQFQKSMIYMTVIGLEVFAFRR